MTDSRPALPSAARSAPPWKLLRRLDLWALIGCVLLFVLWPGLDPLVSGWFYDAERGFHLERHLLVTIPYRLFARIHVLTLLLLLGMLGAAALWRARFGHWLRPGVFLLALLLLGPGLLVNSVVKENSGRPRPNDTVLFGGKMGFQRTFDLRGNCYTNCSFVSGHAAGGYWFIGLAWALRRRRWLLLGIVIGTLVGIGRIVQGGHFLSDVVFAFWIVYGCALLLARLLSLPFPDGPSASPSAPQGPPER